MRKGEILRKGYDGTEKGEEGEGVVEEGSKEGI